MAKTQTNPRRPIASQSDAPPAVQEELDPVIKDYIAALAAQHPFSKNTKIEGKTLLTTLSEFWPDIPEWSGQSFEVWNTINNQMLAVRGGEAGATLHITVSSSPICPSYEGQTGDAVGVISFDCVNGILQHHPAATKDRPAPHRLQIPAGLMVMYRLLQPVQTQQVKRLKVDGELYQARQIDPQEDQNQIQKNPEATPSTLLPAVLLPFIPSGTMADAARIMGESRLAALMSGALSAADVASELKKEAYLRKVRSHAEHVAPLAMQAATVQEIHKKIVERRLLKKQRREVTEQRRLMQDERRQQNLSQHASYVGEDGQLTKIHERRDETVNRRTGNHERRQNMHERRRPDRIGYFGMNNTQTYGLAPADRDYMARQQQRMPEPGKTWTIKNWEDQQRQEKLDAEQKAWEDKQRQEKVDAEQKIADDKVYEEQHAPAPTDPTPA
ncbi:MAG: hypothetical protein WAO98_02880 [Alphaproteobacteria bacterium]